MCVFIDDFGIKIFLKKFHENGNKTLIFFGIRKYFFKIFGIIFYF